MIIVIGFFTKINNMVEPNRRSQFIFPSRLNGVDLEAWSDVDYLQSDTNECVDISKQVVQGEINKEYYFPPELMEKIVCHLDGRTLLKFKMLSKTCNAIVNNALCFNKLWKKICLNEIPKKYLMDLFIKYFNGSFVPFDSFSELQYERFYKNWLQWQSSVFTTTCLDDSNFLGLGEIIQITCYKFDVMVILSQCVTEFSLMKNDAGRYKVKQNTLSRCWSNVFMTLNPHHNQLNREYEQLLPYIVLHQKCDLNFCPLHENYEHGNHNRIFKLIDMNTNIYVNACCWVRDKHYEYHSGQQCVNIHPCKDLYGTMYTSVVHGVIIGSIGFHSNNIVIHNIVKDSCTTIKLWLNNKYIGASAVYIYTNTLFIGTLNGYLLAYRLRCQDDLINLKENNLLLETKLCFGRIVKLDIIDFEDIKVILVASKYHLRWIKIN